MEDSYDQGNIDIIEETRGNIIPRQRDSNITLEESARNIEIKEVPINKREQDQHTLEEEVDQTKVEPTPIEQVEESVKERIKTIDDRLIRIKETKN